MGTVISQTLTKNPNNKIEIVDLKNGRDFRDIGWFEADTVIHLAAIVGDVACREKPNEARSINYRSLNKFILKCKSYGVKRFILASTCSVYGADSVTYCYENSTINPLSLYATTKFGAERTVLNHKSENFHPVVLRFGTAFGQSPSMRYNLVLNHFAKQIRSRKKVIIQGGNQFRPFIHVQDIADIIATLCGYHQHYFRNVCAGEIFNIANENIALKFLGYSLVEWIPNINIEFDPTIQDQRTYKVSCEKARLLLGFAPKISIKEGMLEMIHHKIRRRGK